MINLHQNLLKAKPLNEPVFHIFEEYLKFRSFKVSLDFFHKSIFIGKTLHILYSYCKNNCVSYKLYVRIV